MYLYIRKRRGKTDLFLLIHDLNDTNFAPFVSTIFQLEHAIAWMKRMRHSTIDAISSKKKAQFSVFFILVSFSMTFAVATKHLHSLQNEIDVEIGK